MRFLFLAVFYRPMRGVFVSILAVGVFAATPDQSSPTFALVQPELLSAPGGQTNAWADVDGDGDLDQFVGFRGRANRLYRQDRGVFEMSPPQRRSTDRAATAGHYRPRMIMISPGGSPCAVSPA